MAKRLVIAGVCLAALLAALGLVRIQSNEKSVQTAAPASQKAQDAPVKGMVTMLDLGANECLPCKMMIPVMEKVEKKYKGKAAVIFIDVWKDQAPAKRFGIRAIPTQIFFDKEGREIYRHEGFMSEDAIDRVFQRLGVS